MIATVALWCSIVLAALGALWDIRFRKLPNLLCLALALAALCFTITSGDLGLLTSSALHGLLAILVGMALFAPGWIGAGDAKFYAAVALAVPLGKAIAMLFWTSLAGLAILFVMWVASRTATVRQKKAKGDGPILVPYGVAIAIGYMAVRLS